MDAGSMRVCNIINKLLNIVAITFADISYTFKAVVVWILFDMVIGYPKIM